MTHHTTAELADFAPEDLGRWPGYGEQSWQQRFAELDRQYTETTARFMQHAEQHALYAVETQAQLARQQAAMREVADDLQRLRAMPGSGSDGRLWQRIDAIRDFARSALSDAPEDRGEGEQS